MSINEYLENHQDEYQVALNRVRSRLNDDLKEVVEVNLAHGVSQYLGIRWIKCIFKNDIKMQLEFKDVKGFHVMPYRIRKNDLEKAVISGSKGKFIEQNTDFSDFDITTGNIHICPNGLWQIVLIVNTGTEKNPKFSGPGWKEIESKGEGNSLIVSYEVKEHFYFPEISSEEQGLSIDKVNDDALLNLINNVIERITVNP